MRTIQSRHLTLTRKRALFALAVIAAASMFGFLQAQAPHPLGINSSKYNVAVVDISAIFKRHARFKTTMDNMKKEMESIEAELKADREKIGGAEAQRNGFNAGSAEYKKADEEVAQMMAQFNLKMGRMRKDFLEREAKVYYETYLQVSKAVEWYAKRQNIGLVLRFNGEPIDPNRREEVLREINKPVVYQDQIDITGDILALLNRDQSAAGQPSGQGGGQSGAGQVAPNATQATRPVSQFPQR